MATNDAGIEVPSTTDAFDPDGDMRAMATSLIPRVVIPVANDTARDALTPSAGWLVNRLDTAMLERYDGTQWQPILPTAAGFGTTPTLSPGGATVTREITFPVGRFSVAPVVNLMFAAGYTSSAQISWWASGTTTAKTTFSFQRATALAGTLDFQWTAIQPG